MSQYSNSIKKKLCEMICLQHKSTIKTAKAYDVPLKTLEKWITAYNKNNHYFDEEILIDDFHLIKDFPYDNNNNVSLNYNDLEKEELMDLLMKKDIEITRLKKNYQVIKNGTGKKVFVTFFKKNTK